MEVKEYLERGWKLKAQIELEQKQLEFWQNLSTSTSVNLAYASGGHSGNVNNKLERAMIQVLDLEAKINKDLEQLATIENETLHYIFTTPLGETEKVILQMRYIGYETWRQIAKTLGYAESHIWRIHSSSIKRIADERQ